MKKRRGRPAVPETSKRSVNFTFRGTKALHEKIRLAANASGRSVSDLIQDRLERSFDPDWGPEEVFASRELFALLRILGTGMQLAGAHALALKTNELANATKGWMRDAYAFAQASIAATALLEGMRPVDSPAPPKFDDEAKSNYAKFIGKDQARILLSEIAGNSPGGRGERLRANLDPSIVDQILSHKGLK